MIAVTDQELFHSGDSRYKSPYGAVPTGSSVSFSMRPGRWEGFSRGFLRARFEFQDNRVVSLPLVWIDTQLGRDVFTATLETGGYVGLVWYSFLLEGLDGRRRNTEEFQLTVYHTEEQVPDWFGQGVTYHIFPDRFHRSRIPDPAGLVGGRTVHQSWAEEPEYRPDEKGEIRNRDFFGGDLRGVLEKLDYLQGLGVETLYFCPIFEAAENHRYGTADYDNIDPMLGSMADFTALCEGAHRRGMRVMLDGVFNHTGFVSRYFNGDGFYPDLGAAQSRQSPYFPWFRFTRWPDRYESWWGIYSLPAAEEEDASYQDFIYGSPDSVVRRWLRAGCDGWRLDVADELPDFFVAGIHRAARAEKPDAVIIGEVWEDGSNKMAYGQRRRHILGGHCDGLMNYPLRQAILDFFLEEGGEDFVRTLEALRENYPPFAFHSSMNALGTHDTPRILTLLGYGGDGGKESREWQAAHTLPPEQLALGKRRLMAAAALLYALPGSPTLYYGDEAGMQGFSDPFNRRTFPWGREDHELQTCFVRLGQLRRSSPALRRGELRFHAGEGPLLAFTRSTEEETILVALNSGPLVQTLSWNGPFPQTQLFGPGYAQPIEGGANLHLPPCSATLWRLA